MLARSGREARDRNCAENVCARIEPTTRHLERGQARLGLFKAFAKIGDTQSQQSQVQPTIR